MIKAQHVSKEVATSAGSLRILDDIYLSIAAGDTLAIVGPSGSGKSTLLGLLAGLDVPSSGSIYIDGKDIALMSEEGRAAIRAKYVGFVFQSFYLLPSLTALENVSLPLELRGDTDPMVVARHYLVRVGLNERLSHYPRQLSGGEQQRVALARAFASHPKILFADEPTGNLDTVTGKTINELMFQLNREEGTTLVLVTHEESLANRCHHQVVLSSGRLVLTDKHDRLDNTVLDQVRMPRL